MHIHFFQENFKCLKLAVVANTANDIAFIHLYSPSTSVTLPLSPLSVIMHALKSSCACTLHSTSMPKTNGNSMLTTKNRIVIQQLVLNQTGILHVVVPCIWDPFCNSTVVGLQSTTGSCKACTSSLGAKLLDAPVSAMK